MTLAIAFALIAVVALAIQFLTSDRYMDDDEIWEHRRRVLERLDALPPSWSPKNVISNETEAT